MSPKKITTAELKTLTLEQFYPLVASGPQGLATIGSVILGVILIQNGIGRFFGFNPLPVFALLFIFLMVIVYLAVMEMAKRLFYEKMKVKN